MIRRLAREVALQALFQIDFTGNEVEQAVDAALDEHEELHPEAAVDKALDQHKELGAASARNYVKKYSMVLVNGVVENKEAIDATLNSCATDWTVERMPATDRNILRVAVLKCAMKSLPWLQVLLSMRQWRLPRLMEPKNLRALLTVF